MRSQRRRRERILNMMLIFVFAAAFCFGINLLPSYNSDLTKGETSIRVIEMNNYRSSMVQIKTDDNQTVYTHEIHAAYIAKNVKEGYDKFHITVTKNNTLIYMLKIRPKYEISTIGVEY